MNETTEKVFGYATMGRSFREVIRLREGGLVYRSRRRFVWPDIIGYRAFPDFYPDLVLAAVGWAKPHIALYVKDGSIIQMRGDVLVLADAGSEKHEQTTSRTIFDAFVSELRERGVPKWSGPREEVVLFATAFALFVFGLGGVRTATG